MGSMQGARGAEMRSLAESRRAEADARRAAAEARRVEAQAEVDVEDEAEASAGAAFGAETAARARALRDADLETRQGFGAETSARAQELAASQGGQDQDLESDPDELTDPEVVDDGDNSAFGQDTAARARMLGEGDPEAGQAFGRDQSERARAKSGEEAGEDGDPPDE
jgi:hypothetical protein